jgi:diaminohydroxyphosphoribosylaminopyrimidine deaminase/5-amino-6-(5-phosphoribosylamino)uracil reductase
MRRALALASARLGRTAPNPSVGCVLVKAGEVVAEAATGEGGRPHAEEQALDVAGAAARGAVAYVTLEPCDKRSSGGRSCTDRLIDAGVARVVVAAPDPHPLAAGAGLRRLAASGIEVASGLLAIEAEALNEGFFRVVRRGLPLILRADGPSGFDARYRPTPGEDDEAALRALAQAGLTRLYTDDDEVAARLSAAGLL